MKKFLMVLLAAFTLFAFAQDDTSTDTSAETSATEDAAATGTVIDVIIASPDHTTLLAAVEAAGLAETLAGAGP
jgi:uncharacterized surface protein with fasciclin (FAS1) repeats